MAYTTLTISCNHPTKEPRMGTKVVILSTSAHNHQKAVSIYPKI